MRFARVQGLASGLALALLSHAPAFAAPWKTNVNYGGTTVMDLYVPDQVDASPAAVVLMHGCGANSGFTYDWLRTYSDQYGFVMIAPTAGGACFDAAPVRSGEREAITKMVAYVIAQNHVDATRVYAVGVSSGACMTNALMAAYPDVFAAGSVLAGVPAGSWNGGNNESWSTPADTTAAQWGDIVRNADPGFAGKRPRVQLWHGTADTDLTYSLNFPAEVAQWTNVFGVSDANATKSDFKTAQDTWNRNTYKNASGLAVLETNVATGAPHNLSDRGLWGEVVRFFALEADGTGGSAGSGGASSGGASSGGASSGGASSAGAGSGGGGRAGASAGGSSGSAAAGSAAGGSAHGGNGSSAGASTSDGGSVGGTSRGGAHSGGSSSGAPSNAGGSAATGAQPAVGQHAVAHDDGGCSVRANSAPAKLAALATLLALGAAAVRRRRRRFVAEADRS